MEVEAFNLKKSWLNIMNFLRCWKIYDMEYSLGILSKVEVG